MSPFAIGGVVFLGAMGYALVAQVTAKSFGGWKALDRIGLVGPFAAILWPITLAVVLVWCVMLSGRGVGRFV